MPQRQGRGFAAMDEEEQREISRRGGQASHGGSNGEEEDGEQESGQESGRGAAGSTEAAARGGRNSQGGGQSGGQSGGGQSGGQGAKRVISRTIRVLDEIESRIAELREELEQQGGGGGGEKEGGGRGGRGFAAMDPEERREIASKGGRAAHARGTAHEFDSEEAQEAGRQSHKNR
jgi:general stress protein YciG